MSQQRQTVPNTAENLPNNNNLPEVLPPIPKVKPDLSKLTPYEIAAVTIAQNNPGMSHGAIGRKMKELGLSKNEKTIYRRLSDSDYLSGELARIEESHRETLVRHTYPKAEAVLEQALTSKAVKLKDKLGFVKLAYDKVHGETHKHVAAPTINIGSIEKMQVIMANDLEGTLKDAQGGAK